MSIGQSITHGCQGSFVAPFLASRWRRVGQGFILLVGQHHRFIVAQQKYRAFLVAVCHFGTFGTGFRYSGWHCFAVAFVIPATVLKSSAASSTSTYHASGRFGQMHKLIMLGFFGCAKEFVLCAIIPLGFDMGTSINFFLCWLAGALVITATSTTTVPPSRTTLPKRRDTSPGCPSLPTKLSDVS